MELCPLLFEELPAQARQMVVDDVLADGREMNDSTLGLACEAHLASLSPDELRPMLRDDVGRLAELVRELQLPKVA